MKRPSPFGVIREGERVDETVDDGELLLDRVPPLREVRVLPGEVVHRIERECLQPRVTRAEQRYALIGRRIDDARPADESARREKILVDADHRVLETESLAIAIERRAPQRRLGRAMAEQIVGRTAPRDLKIQ